MAAWGPWISGRNVPGRRFAGGTIRTKPFLVQKANQRQKDHKKKYLRPQQNHGIKKILKKLLGYLFSFLLEQVAGAFRTVQTVGSACQSRSRLSGVHPIETISTSWFNYPTLQTIVNLFCFLKIMPAIRSVRGCHPYLGHRANPGSVRTANSGRLSGARCRTPGQAPRCSPCF